MVDANQGWELDEACEAVVRSSERQLGWIEEPILADSLAEHRAELPRLSSNPVAGGENLAGFEACEDMLARGSHRAIQPDLLNWGGVTGCHAVAEAAMSQGLTYCPHWRGSAVGLIASAQVLADIGGPSVLEHDVMDSPLRAALIEARPAVQNGHFPLPAGPGIGFVPRIEQAEQWLVGQQSFNV